MYLYLFDDKGGFVEEIFVTNHNEFELTIYKRELQDKNGSIQIFESDEQIEEPTLEKVKNHAVV